jgi:hypothetical protein
VARDLETEVSWQGTAEELRSKGNQLNKDMFARENQNGTMKSKSSGASQRIISP